MHLNPTITACWSESGKQVKVESAGDDDKYQVFGSVDYRSGEVIYSQEDRKRTCEFVSHIEQILDKWHDHPVVLICDNYSVHKTKVVKELEKRHFGRLFLVYLPTYSPHLNPIEMLWRYIRRLVTHNHRFPTLAEIKEAIAIALEKLSRQVILSIIGGKRLQICSITVTTKPKAL